MRGEDRSRPRGQGRGTGRGVGSGRRGSMGRGLGPGGTCVCPNCETTRPHERGIPCYELSCPECGAKMVRAFKVSP